MTTFRDGAALVTGARGFIGRHVARALARRGQRVWGVGFGAWRPGEADGWGISRWVEGAVALPLLDELGFEPSVVVQCAGSGSVGFSAANPFACFERTVASTAAVLEYARRLPRPPRVVLASSAAVYGALTDRPLAESIPRLAISDYGVHKGMAEELCYEYARHHGVDCAVVRLFSVYGPGLRKQLLWDACTKLTRGDATFFGTGEETRDFLHVDDAAELLAVAAARGVPGVELVNGGTGVGATTAEVVAALAAACGVDAAPSFSGAARRGDPDHLVADVSRALAWGWRPTVAWRDGVAEYARWFRQGAW